jgi:hypothetical protein
MWFAWPAAALVVGDQTWRVVCMRVGTETVVSDVVQFSVDTAQQQWDSLFTR